MIVARDPIVRRALLARLQTDGNPTATATANGHEAVALASELAPEVAIVDRDGDNDEVLELVERMHRAAPGMAILVLSGGVDDPFALRVLRAGASGFVNDRLPLEILPRLVRSLAAGDAVMTRSLTMQLITLLRHPVETGACGPERVAVQRIAR